MSLDRHIGQRWEDRGRRDRRMLLRSWCCFVGVESVVKCMGSVSEVEPTQGSSVSDYRFCTSKNYELNQRAGVCVVLLCTIAEKEVLG
jgi:hypothetical protein